MLPEDQRSARGSVWCWPLSAGSQNEARSVSMLGLARELTTEGGRHHTEPPKPSASERRIER